MKKPKKRPDPERFFSGPKSRELWDLIHKARTVKDLRYALFDMGCRLQWLEALVRGTPGRGPKSSNKEGNVT